MPLTVDLTPEPGSGPTYTGNPPMNPESSGGIFGGFFGGLSNVLGSVANSQFGAAYGAGLATKSSVGRTPGNESFVNPTQPTKGSAGQPGTTPAVTPTAWQQVMPYVALAGVILTLAGIYKLVFRK